MKNVKNIKINLFKNYLTKKTNNETKIKLKGYKSSSINNNLKIEIYLVCGVLVVCGTCLKHSAWSAFYGHYHMKDDDVVLEKCFNILFNKKWISIKKVSVDPSLFIKLKYGFSFRLFLFYIFVFYGNKQKCHY